MATIEETQARINMYGLLSRLLIEEVDFATLEKIKQTPELLDLFPNTKEWKLLHEKDTIKLIEEDLNPDFTTIFLINVYPYESVFMNDEGHIDASITNPTLMFYHQHGYEIDMEKTRALSPDHIAIEMEFMMSLAKEELNAIAREKDTEVLRLRKLQKKFLEEHLANWGPIYLMAARDIAETPFYYDVCETATEFIMSDYDYLSEILEEQEV